MSRIFEALHKSKGALRSVLQVATERPQLEVARPEPNHRPKASNGWTESNRIHSAGQESHVTAAAVDITGRTIAASPPSSSPVLVDDPRVAEHYRIIRTKIAHKPSQPRIILISSPGPGDGKSVTAVNLATTFAMSKDVRVLLIDGDGRRPTIHKLLGIPREPGLGDVLEEKVSLNDAVVRLNQHPNMFVLPAGIQCANITELLASPQWTSVLAIARQAFDFVIVDAPPAGIVADYALLQATVDGVVLVVRTDHSKRHACSGAVDNIPEEKLLGIIMNCSKPWFMKQRMGYYGHESY